MTKRCCLPVFCLLLTILAVLPSCQKEATDPEMVICYLEPVVPFRVITSSGQDLLSPGALPSGKLGISWTTGGAPVTAELSPGVYSVQGQADQYYASLPIGQADKGLTVYFSVKANDTDTLYLRTAASSSKPYGVAEISFNGKRVDPKMLFGNAVLGLELVKEQTGN